MSWSFDVTFATGEDTEADALIEVTSWGCGPTMPSWNYAGDPGEPPEWDIEKLYNEQGDLVPYWIRPSFFRGLYMELWQRREPRIVNPEWERLASHLEYHMEHKWEWEYPEPDYDEERYYDR